VHTTRGAADSSEIIGEDGVLVEQQPFLVVAKRGLLSEISASTLKGKREDTCVSGGGGDAAAAGGGAGCCGRRITSGNTSVESSWEVILVGMANI